MKITREDLPQREIVLNIELEDEELTPYLERAYQRVVQRVNVPGFRKGKAPRAILERFVGPEALRGEAVDVLVPDVVDRAVKQEQLDQGGVPSVEMVSMEPVVLKAKVPLVPQVVLNSYRDIRLQPETVQVTEEEVGSVLEQLRSDLALWEPVERPVAEGDQVTLDVRAVVAGKDVANQKGVGYLVAQDNPRPVPGFATALVGALPAERKEFTIAIPEDYPDRRLAGEEGTFHVAVHQVKEKRLPELNDEFAKSVEGSFDNLEALKEKIRGDIRRQKEFEARVKAENAVVEALVGRTTMEISPMLVEHDMAHLLQDEEEALKRRQVSVERYLETVGRSPEEYQEEARTRALQRLTRAYALLKVAELEGLSATPEEVEKELQVLVDNAGPQGSTVRRNLSTPDGQESLSRMVVNRKVLDKLVEIAGGLPATLAQAPQEAVEDKSLGGTENAGTTE